MSDFGAFMKAKKGQEGKEEEKKKEPSKKAAPKPPKKPTPPKKEEPVDIEAETVEEETEETEEEQEDVEEPADDASPEEEISTDREDDTESAPQAPKAPAKKAAPSPPKAPSVPKPPSKKSAEPQPSIPPKSSATSTPASQPTPSMTWEQLAEQVQVSDFDDEYDSEGYGDKVSITVVGEKGDGKSTISLAFVGEDEKALVISYDRMAKANKYKMRYPQNLKIVDPMTLFDSSTSLRKRNSMALIYDYLVGVEEYVDGPRDGGLLSTHEPVDWIIHDGTDILMEICEMVMRAKHDLLPAQGVEWNLWKDRKYAIQDIYHKSLSLAKKGVIYTTYFDEKNYDEDITGQKKKKQIPKWMDIILHQTMHTFVAYTQAEGFFMYVAQSKSVKRDITKQTFDVTGVSYESDEIDKETGKKIWKMDFTKLYDVVEEIVREVF